MSIDNRRCHRFQLELPVWFHPPNHQESTSEATTINVSALGICMATQESLPIGDELLIYIRLPLDQEMRVFVRVIWSRDHHNDPIHAYRVGLKIIEPFRYDEAKFVKYFATEMVNFFKEQPRPSGK